MSAEMASLVGAPSIVVATSIPPNVVRYENGHDIGHKYQRECIESWIRAGLRILSLKFSNEISELSKQYPEVISWKLVALTQNLLGKALY